MWKKFAKRVQMMVGRALLEAIDDSGAMQLVQVSGLEADDEDGLERPQPYGLSGNTPKGGELVVLYVQGNKEDGIVVVSGHSALRKKVSDGEVALWSKYASYVHLRDDNVLELSGTGDFGVRFNELKSGVDEAVSDLNDAISKIKTHLHVSAAPGVVTGPAVDATAAPIVLPSSTADVDGSKIIEIEVPS